MELDEGKRIRDNWKRIRLRVDEAAVASGRLPSDVQVIGVCKYVDLPTTRMLVVAGCTNLGESRPQQLWEKSASLGDLPIHWHLIGHLQRNKVKRTLNLVEYIHSVDSLRLLQQIDRDAEELKVFVRVLIELNISGEPNKTGLPAQDLLTFFEASADCKNVQVRGLMGMASLGSSPAQARQEFAAVRSWRDQLHSEFGSNLQLEHLSMGMSGDYVEAILEGATMVRIGSALFDRPSTK